LRRAPTQGGEGTGVPPGDRRWSTTSTVSLDATTGHSSLSTLRAGDQLATHPEHMSPSAYLRASRDVEGLSTSRSVTSVATTTSTSASRSAPFVRSVVPIGSTPPPPSVGASGADGKPGLMPPPPPSFTSFGPRQTR
jgi:hypothetical protein